MKIFVNNAGQCEEAIKEALTETAYTWGEGGINVTLGKCDEGIKIVSDGKNATLLYSTLNSLFRGIGVIISKGETAYETEQKMMFRELGSMVDCSRNGVRRVEKLKQFIRMTSLLGYNMLQVYTEDTYEIEGEPYFGHLRGRYTVDELREIDDYADKFGVEVIPCIQTLAHLDAIFNWPEYGAVRDTGNILNVGLEKSLELIEKMFVTMKSALRSKQINVGMDEAHSLGLGKYLDMFGYKQRSQIMKEHLAKVMELCRKYGYEPMMWSDMFFRVCSPTGGYFDVKEFTPEVLNSVPEDMTIVFWDYYRDDPEFYKGMLDQHMLFNRKVAFAGGASTWYGFAPMQCYSLDNVRAVFKVLGNYPLTSVFNTMWGDNGAECSTFAALPTIAAYSEGTWTGDLSDEALTRAMSIFEASFDDFLEMNAFHKTETMWEPWAVMHKYMLYGDALQGTWDWHVPLEANAHFAKASVTLGECAKRNPRWAYLFEPLAVLAKVLSNKAELGINLKAAYDKGDKAELSRYANEVIPEIVSDLRVFARLHAKRWRIDNKDFGFEVQDARIGGLMLRLEHTAEMLNEYVSGERTQLLELEADRLPEVPGWEKNRPLCRNTWQVAITKGRL